MNPLHLLWIIPLSAGVGAFFMGIVAGGKMNCNKKDKQ